MASRLAAFAIPGHERTGAHVAKLSEVGLELIALQTKSIEIEGSGHVSPDSSIRCQKCRNNTLPLRCASRVSLCGRAPMVSLRLCCPTAAVLTSRYSVLTGVTWRPAPMEGLLACT